MNCVLDHVAILALICIGISLCPNQFLAAESPFDRWESSIAQFEAQDKEAFPAKGGVLFIGSSSIRMWKLDETFPDKKYINRGFGGSEIADSIHFADRIVFPYKPSIIVMYAGDNDLAKKKTPEVVSNDFATFAKLVKQKLPATKLIYIAIKPSIKRWNLIKEVRDANSRITKQCQQHQDFEFVDIDTPMIGEDGKPRQELFIKDGLHLSDKGYAIWTKLVAEKIATFAEQNETK